MKNRGLRWEFGNVTVGMRAYGLKWHQGGPWASIAMAKSSASITPVAWNRVDVHPSRLYRSVFRMLSSIRFSRDSSGSFGFTSTFRRISLSSLTQNRNPKPIKSTAPRYPPGTNTTKPSQPVTRNYNRNDNCMPCSEEGVLTCAKVHQKASWDFHR